MSKTLSHKRGQSSSGKRQTKTLSLQKYFNGLGKTKDASIKWTSLQNLENREMACGNANSFVIELQIFYKNS